MGGALDVVDAVYAAALDANRWDNALDSLAKALHGVASGLHVEERGQPVIQRWVGLDPDFSTAYLGGYWQHDPWAAGARRLASGTVGFGDTLVPRQELEASTFHQELGQRFAVDDLMVAAVEHSPNMLALVTVTRGRGQRFTAEDGALFDRLVPHFSRALHIAKRLRTIPYDDLLCGTSDVETRLRRAYPLTPTEAKVAALVGRGLAPKEAAVTLGTAWNTVRAQLRQIYAKTETSGQSELARLVTRVEFGN